MAILKIITAPDPILKQKAAPVSHVDDELRKLMDDMLETMYHDNGVGLAANQVGVAKRVVALDLQGDDDMQAEREKDFYPLYLVNPIITYASEEKREAMEACLSVPEQKIKVTRPSEIKIKYLDYHNCERELEATGWLARAIQHEMDHLDGKLLIDYLSNLKKTLVVQKLTKLKKAYA